MLLTRGVELFEVGDEIADPLLVLQAGRDHLGAGKLRARVPDVLPEDGLVLLWVSALLTLYTGWDYLKTGIQHLVDEG